MSKPTNSIKDAMRDRSFEGQLSLLGSGLYSDMTITSGSHTFKVHCAILSVHSTYFEKACESKFLEHQTRTITLHEDDSKMVASMIYFIYTGDYKDEGDGKKPIIYNAGMYAIGDKYDVPLLKRLAQEKFAMALLDFDPSMTPTLIEAINIVYTTTLSSDRDLRDCFTQVLKMHKSALRKSNEFMELFSSGLDDGGFAIDVVDAWAVFLNVALPQTCRLTPDPLWHCNNCNSTNRISAVYHCCWVCDRLRPTQVSL